MRLLGVAAIVLAVVAGAAGCGSAEEGAPDAVPTPRASSPAPTAQPTRTVPTKALATGTAGSDGLTVRYRDDDGSLQTVRVEDFPR